MRARGGCDARDAHLSGSEVLCLGSQAKRPRSGIGAHDDLCKPVEQLAAIALFGLVAVRVAIAQTDDGAARNRQSDGKLRGRDMAATGVDRIDGDRLGILAIARHDGSVRRKAQSNGRAGSLDKGVGYPPSAEIAHCFKAA